MLVVNDDVYVANLGDSRVSMGICGYYGNTDIMGNSALFGYSSA